MPIANPHAKVALAAELLEQSVVAAAAGNRALRAQAIGHPFEHRAVVIVESAHEPRVRPRRHAGVVEQRFEPSKCASDLSAMNSIIFGAPAMSASSAGFLLSRIRKGLVREASSRVVVELRLVLREIGDQRVAMVEALVAGRRAN